MSQDHFNRETDPARPPAIPVEVFCVHCGREYESYQMQWRPRRGRGGATRPAWCCPTEGCPGAGFGRDILPIEPSVSALEAEDEASPDDEAFEDEAMEPSEAEELEAFFEGGAEAGWSPPIDVRDEDCWRRRGDDSSR